MRLFVFCLSWLLAFSVVLAAGAEGKEEKDEDMLRYHVVVTASRSEESRLELGSTTTVISAEEIKKSGKRTVVEALAAAAGVEVVQNGGIGKAASVFIRGANSEHTLVMIDGVELNDPMSPSRSYDLAHLSLDNIDRIEIVHGPQSTLYGSDALGGIIHIITKKGEGKPSVFFSAEGGAYNSFRESAGISGGTEKVNYSLGVSRFDTEGFSASAEKYGNSERDGYGNTSVSTRLGIKPVQNLDIDVMARYFTVKNDIDSGPGQGGDDPNAVDHTRQLVLAANARLSLVQDKWQQRVGAAYNRINYDYDNPFDELHPFDADNGIFKGRVFKLDWQHDLFLFSGNTITAGIEYEKEYGESEYNWQSLWGPGQSLFPEKSASTTGIYLQDNLKLQETFFVILGVRLDDHSRFGSQVTFRLAPALVLKTGTKVKGSYGTGFKAPSLYQLFAPATPWGPIGNDSLEAEKNRGWDVGIEQFLFNDRLHLEITYFHNDFENLIQYDWIQGFVNVAQAQTSGVEVSAAVLPMKNFSIQGNYTYTRSKDKISGEKLLRRPENRADLVLNYRFADRANVNLNLLYVGKREDYFPYPDRVVAEPYTLVNLVLSYQVSNNVEAFARIDNLFDREYEVVLGYGSAGRSAYVGLRLTN